MSEVYKRWPEPVDVITNSYSNFADKEVKEVDSILLESSSFKNIKRQEFLMKNWGIDNISSLKKYALMRRYVKNRLIESDKLTIHATHAVPEITSLLFLKRQLLKKAKIVSYAHGEEILACNSSVQLTLLQEMSYKICDLIIANSENTKKLLTKITKTPVEVINPGINYEEFANSEELGKAWRKKNNFKDDDFLLFTLARLCPRKNQSSVIDALMLLKERFPKIHYIVAGGGEQKKELKEQVDAFDLNERVHFYENVSDKEKIALYGASDLFVMPSKQIDLDIEGFGISYIEAAAAGKTSIAGNSGGEKESVLHNETGKVLKDNTKEEIAHVIMQLYENVELRDKLADNAKKRAKGLDWGEVVRRSYGVISGA